VGEFEQSSGTPEKFGLLLAKGSDLTSCASAAVDSLDKDGTLKKLQDQWLTQATSVPELK
jgi:polar amino acid transport system substrate-binding protein